jgi:hypothetical protein
MLNIRKWKPVLLGLAFLLALVATSLVADPAFAVRVYSGEITRIDGDTITLNGSRKFVPANEHTRLPTWAREGAEVKVGYYTQNKINYYQEIAKPGKMLKVEKREAWSSRTNE